MRKLLWLLLGLIYGVSLAPIQAQQSVMVPATASTIGVVGTVSAITKTISGATGKRIYLTAVGFHPAATSVLTLTEGTGTNCATSPNVLYGPATFQASENWYQGTGNGAIITLSSGTDLCVTIATAVAPGFISYVLF